MKTTVKIPDEITADPKACGVAVGVYIQVILAQQVGTQPSGTRPLQTPAEIRAWLDYLAQFSDKIPPFPEIFYRQWIIPERH